MVFIWLRSPRTTNEKRDAAASEADGIKVRAKRTHRRLPDVYDDIFITESKSWKRAKRRKQWQHKKCDIM